MAPQNSVISKMFGTSPVQPLQAHMAAAVKCAREIPDLIEAMNAGDQDRVNSIKERVFQLENDADDIKNAMRSHLPKSLFMPVDRRDLLEILQMQDSIADTAQDIAGLVVERPMTTPEQLSATLLELAKVSVETCEYAEKIIGELDELVAMGFGGKEASTVEEMVAKLNEIEDKSDKLGLEAARTLFEHEDELKPVSVMIWYRIIEWIGDLADYAEKVGDRLRLLIAR